jgi:hypothetical protein
VHLHIDDSDEVKEQIWKDEGDLIQVHDNHACTATGLAWLRDGRGLTTTCYGGVKLWRVGRKPPEKHFQWKSSFLSLSISPNDKHLAAGCQDTSLFVWNGRNDKNVGMSGYPGKISLLGWNASSRYLASGAGKEAVLWDFAGAGPAQPGTFGAQPPRRPPADLKSYSKQDVLATVGEDGGVDPLARTGRQHKGSFHPEKAAFAAGLESPGRVACRRFGGRRNLSVLRRLENWCNCARPRSKEMASESLNSERWARRGERQEAKRCNSWASTEVV